MESDLQWKRMQPYEGDSRASELEAFLELTYKDLVLLLITNIDLRFLLSLSK